MPLLSVVIPCYNSERWIRQALDSVFVQNGADFEVLAVDDGSTDDTLAILSNYGRGVRVFSQANQGAGVARNLAVSHATGDYIATLDADDLWFPWTVPVYRDLVTRFHRPSIIAGRPYRFKDEQVPEKSGPMPVECRKYANFYEAARDGFWFLLNGALLIRRDVLLQCGGFAAQKINCEDTHLFLNFGMTSEFVAVSSPQLFGYRSHDASAIYNTHLSFRGCNFLVNEERRGAYPGGDSMKNIRRSIITTHCRAASIALLKTGNPGQGWQIYRRTIGWHLVLGRIKYLLGFPALMLIARWKKALS